MKRAVKIGGSNIDWGELRNRFTCNTPLYYIFANFLWSFYQLFAKIEVCLVSCMPLAYTQGRTCKIIMGEGGGVGHLGPTLYKNDFAKA